MHILLAVDMAGVAWQGLVCVRVCVCVCVCVCVEVGKMAKDIGMTIRKGIVVPFLPCLVAFWGFHPHMFFQCFFVTNSTYNVTDTECTLHCKAFSGA